MDLSSGVASMLVFQRIPGYAGYLQGVSALTCDIRSRMWPVHNLQMLITNQIPEGSVTLSLAVNLRRRLQRNSFSMMFSETTSSTIGSIKASFACSSIIRKASAQCWPHQGHRMSQEAIRRLYEAFACSQVSVLKKLTENKLLSFASHTHSSHQQQRTRAQRGKPCTPLPPNTSHLSGKESSCYLLLAAPGYRQGDGSGSSTNC
ncbi:hypothetical protein Nmel_006956 [Mimus melanotis]